MPESFSKNGICKTKSGARNFKTDMLHSTPETWQTLMEAMITFSKNAEKLIAANSGHYMHLTDQEIVLNEIRKIFVRQPN